MSGQEAIKQTLSTHYDVILMDHLMPEMDGIECLDHIRHQTGGLNREVPVIVLTANAGSENRDLYNRAGFDGYLVKPVSGASLEDALIKHISEDKLTLRKSDMRMGDGISTTRGYFRKAPVVITSTTMCDLPHNLIKKLHLNLLPVTIKTEEGIFKDTVQMGSDELIRYIDGGGDAISAPPTVLEYTEFFAEVLKTTHHIIHIAYTTSLSEDYERAMEAAKAFDNVTVINSEALSSATGILVLMAYKLAQQNIPVQEIVDELEVIKKRIRCSFVIETTEYMAKKGNITQRLHSVAKALDLHPCLTLKDDRSGIGGVWMGDIKRAYRKYIRRAIPADIIPDPDILFITYVDIPQKTLQWIREEVSKVAYFEHVVFMQASAAISSNCGSGTFGVLYFVKGNKYYGLSTLLPENREDAAETAEPQEPVSTLASADAAQTVPLDSSPWYDQIEGIDSKLALKNSGSEDALKMILKIFYDSIPGKTGEIEGYYADEDWHNYTIKVHALKSSARLIGATKLGEAAQLLESAGKDGDTEYIRAHHQGFMAEYAKYRQFLAGACGDAGDDSGSVNKPEADEDIMSMMFADIKSAAEDMDCGRLEDIFSEMDEYRIPDEHKELFGKLREASDNYEYDELLSLLSSAE